MTNIKAIDIGVNGILKPIKIPIIKKKTSCNGMYFNSFTQVKVKKEINKNNN
ncbi:MAG: hypothetical protein L3J20_03765 [Flavobacteriaceae bacterium]|nr:hypothetical protein [Flavobacteriaceae bacterium]